MTVDQFTQLETVVTAGIVCIVYGLGFIAGYMQ